ncbi:hypothetical protein L3Q82_006908 [Scortum barcoo]|uniref:Uncharacterized protein n=1 Tax=Scortum barcoo TaxID=214431 RepID=A0ACB8WW43_9TELE|nr:hypothetical protein L3Q82_006908 [Scortum barcoo]
MQALTQKVKVSSNILGVQLTVVYYGVKLLLFSRMLFAKLWFPPSKSFFTSTGEWAVVTGASEGIGRAYAFAMCRLILPGMDKRRKGLIVNISSGIASIPFPMYTLYAASKVFVERLSQGLQAEYKDKGIIIQTVAPFGVSTRMAAYQKTNMMTLSPEDFVKSSLQYIRSGDKTHGSVCHIIL